jgi:hypothetical protein
MTQYPYFTKIWKELLNGYNYDALILLKSCLGGPTLQCVLRTSPCCGHSILTKIDDLLRSAVTKICNTSLIDEQWIQASLPVSSGGLGVRRVYQLASTAFLASAAGTHTLQAQILRNCPAADEDLSVSLDHWLSLTGRPAEDALTVGSQRVLDSAVIGHIFESLVKNQTTQYQQARLLAAAAAYSGDWLHAVPIPACGLRLNDEAIRVAVGLRLGCQPYRCVCGASVDTRGSHALSCKRNPGRCGQAAPSRIFF